MKIIKAESAGFCFGVKRAVDTVYKCTETGTDEKIYTYGPIIHNEEVVKDLENKGVKVINRLEEFQEIHDFARFMIHFRAKHPILRRDTKPAVCGLPSVSIHNGEPNRNYTDYNTHLIGIMYAGRNADDTDDDMIFYGMNAYWEPLEMRLPSLPESYHWKLVVNTFCEYQDGADFEAQTQGDQTRVRVPERSTVILLAEHDL